MADAGSLKRYVVGGPTQQYVPNASNLAISTWAKPVMALHAHQFRYRDNITVLLNPVGTQIKKLLLDQIIRWDSKRQLGTLIIEGDHERGVING
jgi:hypothetical protein